MPWNDHFGPVPDLTEDEFLALVRQKAHATDTRRRRLTTTAAAALLLVGLAATVVTRNGGGAGTELHTVAGGPTTSTAASPAIAGEAALVPMPTATTTTMGGFATTLTTVARPPSSLPPVPTTGAEPSAPTTTVPATTTTSLACENGSEIACGPFGSERPPRPNQPIALVIEVSPVSPKAGATMNFHVTVDDPDGGHLLSRGQGTVDYGDGESHLGGISGHIDCPGRSGASGEAVPVHEEITYEHVYATAGTYTATFAFKTLGTCAYPPSEATKTVTFTVIP